jgi:hypothetical protein
MTNWEQPHWSGKPQEKSAAKARMKPNGFARLARFSADNATVIIVMTVFLAVLAAGLAAFSIRVVPDHQPLISLDDQTARAQALLDAKFPGIDNTFFATIESEDANYARRSALAVAAALRAEDKLFNAVIVPGEGAFYDTFGLLFLPSEELNGRVARLLRMQPLYFAFSQAPSLKGLSVLVGEIARNVAAGHSPPGLEDVLSAVSGAVEREVENRPAAIDWVEVAGLRHRKDSKRWFIIAEPVKGQEQAAAATARVIASQINGLTWSFPPYAATGEPDNLLRDLFVPAILSAFAVTVILMAGLSSVRQTLAVMACAGAGLAFSAGLMVTLRPLLDAVTWSFAVAVITPALLFGLCVAIPFGEARARGKSPSTAVMLAAHRAGPRILVFAALGEILWLSWLPRQIDSLAIMAVSVAAGIAIAVVLSLLFVPAVLAAGRHAAQVNFHWIDDAVAGPASNNARNLRALLALVVMAAAVFCTIFVPNVKFGDTQLRLPRGATINAPNSVGAVHLLARPEEAADLVKRVGAVPEAGALRWIEQFIPQDLAAKRQSLAALLELLPATNAAIEPADGAMLSAFLARLEADLRIIANHPSTGDSLRSATHRLRRALGLFMASEKLTVADVRALESAVFEGLPALARETERLARLPEPKVTELEASLRNHFVAADGTWRFEVLPKPGVTTLTFAAAMRKLTPDAAGVPVVALARNEIMHHEAILAFAPALAIAGLLAVLFARRVDRIAVALVPTPMALAMSSAAIVASGELLDAASLGAIAAAIAASMSASLIVAFGAYAPRSSGEWEMNHSYRGALLPLLAALAAVAPLIASGKSAISEYALIASIFLAASVIANGLIGTQLSVWLREALRPAPRERRARPSQ